MSAGPLHIPLIGLTGPIGCGKSTVSHMLAELGGTVIDADDLAREVTRPGEPTLPEIRRRFGDDVFAPDGSLNRAALADVVFNDPRALADLEAITHPAVRRRLETVLASATREEAPFVVVEAIKLVEGGLADRCDEVWIIECSRKAQLERLEGRGVSPSDAAQRIATQGAALGDRLAALLDGRLSYRRISTDPIVVVTTKTVEDALVDVLGRFA